MLKTLLLLATLLKQFTMYGIQTFRGEAALDMALDRVPHAVIGYFSSVRKPESQAVMEELLRQMSKEEVLNRDNFRFYLFDMEDDPYFFETYNITAPMTLSYSVNRYKHEFRFFEELANDFFRKKLSKGALFQRALGFVTHKLGKLRSKLHSLEDFDRKLAKHKLLAVFLGYFGYTLAKRKS